MSTLTPEGQRLVQDLARRHGFGEEAVTRMLAAIAVGEGRMAQFDHPEFGGSGQWMAGGMLMLGDMFNQSLKGRVDALCTALSDALIANGPLYAPAQSQRQSQGQLQGRSRGGENGDEDGLLPDTPFFKQAASSSWWPPALGTPTALGSQDSTRYAWFAEARRLALNSGGEISLHDTLDHRIGGFSQQQGGGGGLSMSSQHGTIDPTTLPRVSLDDQARSFTAEASSSEPSPIGKPAIGPSREASTPAVAMATRDANALEREEPLADEPSTDEPFENEPGTDESRTNMPPVAATRDDPVQLIERLGQLHERGLLTDEEFSAKKQELLARL